MLLLERSHWPSDTISTHLIHQPGVALLAKWGVLEAVVATGCPAIESGSYHIADVDLYGSSDPVDGHAVAYAPRRYLLDSVLVNAAVEAGVEFVDRASVVGLVHDEHGAVAGVRYRTADGAVHEARSRLVVGADGMRSDVARLTGAPAVLEDPTMSCVYYAYWRDLPPRFALHEAPGRFVGFIPTNDSLTVVAAYFPQDRFAEVRRDARQAYLDVIARTVPELGDLQRHDDRIGKLHGFGDQRNFFRRASGAGWLLVGDAGHHKDSITARGISDAFTQVDLFATHVLPALDDDDALRGALVGYQELRDEALMESYHNTLSVARLEVQEDRLRLLRAISGDQRLTDQYFSIVSGAASVEEVYSQEGLLETTA